MTVPRSRAPQGWPAVASLGLLSFALLVGLRRSADLDELALTEVPGVVGWLLLALLHHSHHPVRVAEAGDRVTGIATQTGVTAVAVAVLHTIAWSTDLTGFRVVASALVVAAVPAFLFPMIVRREPLTVPALGAIVGAAILTVTVVLEIVGEWADVPPDVVDARGPGIAAVAVIVGMALAESALRGEPHAAAADVAGTVQFLLFAVGWAALVAGAALADVDLGVTSVGLHVLALVVFLVRIASRIPPRAAPAADVRWTAMAVIAAAAYVGLLLHVIAGLVDTTYADASAIPGWLEVAVDLAVFAGLAGNGTLGSVSRAERGRRDLAALTVFNGAAAVAIASFAGDLHGAARVAWAVLVVPPVVVALVAGRALVYDASTKGPGQAVGGDVTSGRRPR